MEHVIIGSTSKHKLESVKEACKNLDLHFKVLGIKTESNQNEQPIGFDETFAGALARAKSVQEKYPLEIAIGIESGIIRAKNPLAISLDLAVIVMIYKDQIITTTSNGMQFPEKYVNIAERKGFKDFTAGSVISSKFGGDATDPHSTLSMGSLSRQETLTKAIEVAFRLLFKFKKEDVSKREQIICKRYCSFNYLSSPIEKVIEFPESVTDLISFAQNLSMSDELTVDNQRRDRPYSFYFFG